jgi:hypothetical protein
MRRLRDRVRNSRGIISSNGADRSARSPSGPRSQGNVTATTVTLGQGSPGQELLVVIQGLNLTTGTPTVVLVQPRQSVNQNQGFSDEYVTQVITTSKTEIQVLVRRVDANSGWGQHLRLDLFIVD